MHPRSLTRFIASALVAATMAASNVRADEINDLLKKAESDYEAGNYSDAMSSLDYAGQLIRQKKGETMMTFLPDALKDWEADEPSSEAAAGALFGGAVSVQRTYTKGDASVSVKITTDSPMLTGMLGMLTNPLMVSSSGGKLETIKGKKAVVKYDTDEKSGEVTVVVGEKVLVQVDGSGVERSDLTGYANAVDYGKLGSF